MADRDDRFRPLEGLPGKLYVPPTCRHRKHPCADCFSCQWCSDTRCAACRGKGGGERQGGGGESGQG